MQKIVLATGNQGKISEITSILAPLSLQLIPQHTLSITAAAENGLSFIENALIKARHAARFSGLPAISDDSGLLVEALQRRPGVHSARYAGEHSNYATKIQRLLDELSEKQSAARSAAFYCVIVYIQNHEDPTPIIAEGIWEGEISHTPAGEMGFGYDPIFYLPQQQCTVAELSQQQKNQLSHRAQALHMLKQKLMRFLPHSTIT